MRLIEQRERRGRAPAAIVELDEAIIRMRNGERLPLIRDLPQRLHVSLSPAPDCRALTWEDLRAMARQGLEIGAHTCTHPILSRLGDERGMVDGAADLYQLPRIGVDPSLDPLYFERCVAGFRL